MILLVCLFCGCSASNEDVTSEFKLPKELEDYKVMMLEKEAGTTLYVLVKKNGEDRNVIGTSNPQGKVINHTIVVDDVEYIRKDSK